MQIWHTSLVSDDITFQITVPKEKIYAHPVTKALYDDSAISAGLGPKQALISATNPAREHFNAQLGCFDYQKSAYSGPWGEQFEDSLLLNSLVKDWDEGTQRAFAAGVEMDDRRSDTFITVVNTRR